MVNDIHRPDVKGTPPKMQVLADELDRLITGTFPFSRIKCDDNIMSSITIWLSLTPRDKWPNGILENSKYCLFQISPANGNRYYTADDEKVTVKLIAGTGRFRKYTGTFDKCVHRMLDHAQWPFNDVSFGKETRQ